MPEQMSQLCIRESASAKDKCYALQVYEKASCLVGVYTCKGSSRAVTLHLPQQQAACNDEAICKGTANACIRSALM